MAVQHTADPAQTPTPPAPSEPRLVGEPVRKARLWRRICVAVLLILGFILTPVAVLVTYAKTEILDTDRYVATVKPLASDPAIQNYVADQITTSLLAQVDVKAYVSQALTALPTGGPLSQALPGQAASLQGLAGPIANAVQNFVHQAALRVVQSSQFQNVWVQANRVAHAQMVKVLTNEGGAVKVQKNGAVQIDLRGVAGAVQQQLISGGLTVAEKIPLDKVNGSITIFQSEDLYKARRGAKLLDTVGYALPFIVFACLGGAVALSARKRRGFVKAAVAFALGALVLALLVNAARHFYLGALPTDVPQSAAAAIFDTLLRSLHTSARNILFVAIVIAVVAWISGPSHPAIAFRNWWARAVTWLGADADHAGWGLLYASPWVARNKRLLRIILAVVVFAVAFRWPHPTTAVLFWVAIVGLIGLVIIDFYGRQPAVKSPVSGGAPTGEG